MCNNFLKSLFWFYIPQLKFMCNNFTFTGKQTILIQSKTKKMTCKELSEILAHFQIIPLSSSTWEFHKIVWKSVKISYRKLIKVNLGIWHNTETKYLYNCYYINVPTFFPLC